MDGLGMKSAGADMVEAAARLLCEKDNPADPKLAWVKHADAYREKARADLRILAEHLDKAGWAMVPSQLSTHDATETSLKVPITVDGETTVIPVTVVQSLHRAMLAQVQIPLEQ